MMICRLQSRNCGLLCQRGFHSTRKRETSPAGLMTWKRSLMHDELKEEGIVNKVGGRFKLSTLIQKRMVALNTGAKPLVDLKSADKLEIVLQEIIQDKIYLDAAGNVQATNMTATANLPAAFLPGGGTAPPSAAPPAED